MAWNKRLRNLLLENLPPQTVDRLLKEASFVQLPLGTTLTERDQRPKYILFLTSGIASVVFSSERGTSVELSTEGREGLVGWINLLGPALLDGECSMQVQGAGYRIPLTVMQREFEVDSEVRRRILEYAQHQIVLANQILACNRLHRAEARFSRWLLMVSDRIQESDLPMTQEFMSMMLGTRRTTVAEVASDLARFGAVEGRRGGLRIVDRAALEGRTCECYGILKSRFDLLYKASAGMGRGPGLNAAPPAVNS